MVVLSTRLTDFVRWFSGGRGLVVRSADGVLQDPDFNNAIMQKDFRFFPLKIKLTN